MYRYVSRSLIGFFALTLCAALLGADEGMWPLYELNKLPFDNLQARGLELTPEQITNDALTGVADAVVNVGGGTGSFVSPLGLIITNHHVAFGAIQKQSTLDQNYIRDGFYASTREDEIPAIGFNVYVSLSSEDVTERVLSKVTEDMDALGRYEAIDRVIKEIVQEAEKDRDVKCHVAKMFGGRQFILYTEFMIRDIRIVYAPPEAIGNYGDEIDNWMWPRHTGDFSFLRAYVAPDGSSSEYSKENVPYRPKSYLALSSGGVKEGDLMILLGYPGRTDRYVSSYSIDHLFEFYYPYSIAIMEDVKALLEELEQTDPDAAIRTANTKAYIDNFLKKDYGLVKGYQRLNMLQKKNQDEADLMEFLKADPKLFAKYGTVLEELESLYREHAKTREKDLILGWLTWESDYLNLATTVHKWSIEREKPDMERERRYQNRDTVRAIEKLRHAQINLVPDFDKISLKLMIRKALDLPEDQRITAVDNLFNDKTDRESEQAIDQFLDNVYANSRIGDLERRLAMFHMTREELENLGDPFIDFAVALRPELDQKNDRNKVFKGAESRLEPLLIQAYVEWSPRLLYPDANGSKRINFGEVKGYSPADAIDYFYMTGLTGVMEKETGEFPFIIPDELKRVYTSGDFAGYIDPAIEDVPVDFLTTNDGTNGNSGSPVLNGKGDIVGLNFDGNFESVADDYMSNERLSRSIMCDSRYVLFVIDKVYNLTPLLEELTIH